MQQRKLKKRTLQGGFFINTGGGADVNVAAAQSQLDDIMEGKNHDRGGYWRQFRLYSKNNRMLCLLFIVATYTFTLFHYTLPTSGSDVFFLEHMSTTSSTTTTTTTSSQVMRKYSTALWTRQFDESTLMIDAGYFSRPRVLLYSNNDYDESQDTSVVVVEQLDPNSMWSGSSRADRRIVVDRKLVKARKYIEEHGYRHPKPLNHGDCKAQYDWQLKSFPTCNTLHEHDLSLIVSPDQSEMNISFIASGGFRDVWKVDNSQYETAALKTLILDEDFDLDNLEGHRLDAVATDRLSFSPFVASVFSVCGNSGLFEFGHGGSLQDFLFGDWYGEKSNVTLTSQEKLILGYQVAASVRDVHNTDRKGRAAISHTDVKPKQFIYMPKEGLWKLTDFNRGKFLAWDNKKNQICPFKFGKNGGKYRSPEEYNYEPETEKIDVYMVGNVLYSLLTELTPFGDISSKHVKKLVARGKTPEIDKRFLDSTDISEMALLKAMSMCWEYYPEKRATSQDVADYIRSQLDRQHIKDVRLYFK